MSEPEAIDDQPDQTDQIDQFVGITNADERTARFYLGMAGGDMDAALIGYFDNVPSSADDVGAADAPPPQPPVDDAPPRPPVDDAPPVTTADSSDDRAAASSSTYEPTGYKHKKWMPRATNRVMTFGSLKNSETNKDKDGDAEEGQRYFAGGSGSTGQQVVGPPRAAAGSDFIARFFRTAQKTVKQGESTGGGSSSASQGQEVSYVLGTGDNDLQQTTGNDAAVVPVRSSGSGRQQVVVVVWRDGFTVNGGRLYDTSDPANEDILNAIYGGKIISPSLLEEANLSDAGELQISTEHYDENYTKPNKNLLKNSAAEEAANGGPEDDAPSDNGVAETVVSDEAAGRARVPLQSDAPTTRLQIRLADGTRLVATFNHGHTVGDVRRYIIAARSSSTPFTLWSSYPPRQLDKIGQTLADAGLLNCVIFQRIG